MEKEIEEIREQLARIVKPEAIEKWLDKPNKRMLKGLTPRQMVEKGEADKIKEMLGQVEWGIHT